MKEIILVRFATAITYHQECAQELLSQFVKRHPDLVREFKAIYKRATTVDTSKRFEGCQLYPTA